MSKNWNVAIGSALILGFFLFMYWLISSNANLAIGLIAGLMPSFITIWQYKQQVEREHKNWLMRNREACLVETIDIFISLVRENKEYSEKKLEQRVKRLLPALFAHASAPTLKAWEKMKEISPHTNQRDIIRKGERFFRAIRKDLGHDDSELRAGALYGTLLDADGKQQALKACKGETYD